MARTLGTLLAEARTLLQDKTTTDAGEYRYTDDEIFEAMNGAFAEIRAKRPDLYLDMGLRSVVPLFVAANDQGVAFPLDISVYNAVLYYIVGRCELREDTFADDGRATVLMNKFASQLLGVLS